MGVHNNPTSDNTSKPVNKPIANVATDIKTKVKTVVFGFNADALVNICIPSNIGKVTVLMNFVHRSENVGGFVVVCLSGVATLALFINTELCAEDPELCTAHKNCKINNGSKSKTLGQFTHPPYELSLRGYFLVWLVAYPSSTL